MSSVELGTYSFYVEPPFNSTCGSSECEFWLRFPPPPSILHIPPPPLPSFMEKPARVLGNRSCELCHWAISDQVGFIELPRTGPALDDTWFFVLISSCVGVTLLGIAVALLFLRYRQQKLKTTEEPKEAGKKVLPTGLCEAVMYASTVPDQNRNHARSSRALWAGLKTSENHYTVDHVQPVDQKVPGGPGEFLEQLQTGYYDYADYGSAGYTSLSPEAYKAESDTSGTSNGQSSDTTLRDSSSSHQYAVPNLDLEGSFENSGFVDSDENAEKMNNGMVRIGGSMRATRLEAARKLDGHTPRAPGQYESFRLKPVRTVSDVGTNTSPQKNGINKNFTSLPRSQKHWTSPLTPSDSSEGENIYAQPFEGKFQYENRRKPPLYTELSAHRPFGFSSSLKVSSPIV